LSSTPLNAEGTHFAADSYQFHGTSTPGAVLARMPPLVATAHIVGANSACSFPPKGEKLACFVAPPLPKKSYDFSGTPTTLQRSTCGWTWVSLTLPPVIALTGAARYSQAPGCRSLPCGRSWRRACPARSGRKVQNAWLIQLWL